MTNKIKQVIIVVVVIIIAFVGFRMFFGSSSSSTTALEATNSTENNFIDGQAILVLLSKLNSITLDETIFTDTIFASLVSFERPIAQQIVERPNPFAPVGVDGAGVVAASSTAPRGLR